MTPGATALELLQSAVHSVLIVAPFIKASALKRLIETIPSQTTVLTCITRWLPEDIASSVCDLEILDIIAERPGASLLVHPHLHAKYYRVDQRCLVGSANVTHRALGWVTPANIELLVELPAETPGLREWELSLIESSIPATKTLQDQIRIAAEKIHATRALASTTDLESGNETPIPVDQWLPQCPVPERLWSVYEGRAVDTMVTGAREAAERDILALAPPPGLNKDLFEAYVVSILKQMPLLVEIDNLAASGMTDTNAHEFLANRSAEATNLSPNESWRVLKAWLTHFFPNTYRLDVAQEVLVKGKTIVDRL